MEKLRETIADLRNSLDFNLRKTLQFPLRPGKPTQTPQHESDFQREMGAFFALLEIPVILTDLQASPLVSDIGCRNFSLAPVIEKLFSQKNPEIHGFEVDAHRRLRNLWTRNDYGVYFARQAQRAFYHPYDFRKWPESSFHVHFLLNPFVTLSPHLKWGLPKSLLRPDDLFLKIAEKTVPGGWLILSNPSEKEWDLSLVHLKRNGFVLKKMAVWRPSKNSIQKSPRLGGVFQRY